MPSFPALFAAILLTANLATAQSAFEKSVNHTSQTEQGTSLTVLPDGKIALAGNIAQSTDAQDVGLTLLTESGDLIWSKKYGGAPFERALALELAADGNLLLMFSEAPNGVAFPTTTALVKISPVSGTVIWAVKIGTASLQHILPTTSGYLLTGSRQSGLAGNPALAMEINESGSILWQQTFVNQSVAEGAWRDGLGFSHTVGLQIGTGSTDGFLTKIAPSGQVLWAKTLKTGGQDQLRFVVPAGQDRLLVAGQTDGFSSFYEVWVSQLDLDGDLKWSKTYNIPDTDLALYDMLSLPGGGALLSFGPFGPAGSGVAKLLKINSEGDLLWAKNYPGTLPGGNSINQIRAHPDGGFVATGLTLANAQSDFRLLKLDADGQIPDCCATDVDITAKDVAPTLENLPANAAQPGFAAVPTAVPSEDLTPILSTLCQPANLDFAVSSDTLCPGECLEITFASPTPGVDYSWKFQNGTPASSEDTRPAGKICFPTEGFVTLTAKVGLCSRDKSVKINLNRLGEAFPTAFTPNGDQTNDRFRPLLNGCPVEDYHLQIYSRWGELVWESFDPAEGWDGITLNFSVAPSDVYVWLAQFTASEDGAKKPLTKTGNVTLLR